MLLDAGNAGAATETGGALNTDGAQAPGIELRFDSEVFVGDR